MEHLDFFREVNAEKQIKNWVQKLKNKKIVIYGDGIYFQLIEKNYDLSKLNIVAISDKKFATDKTRNTTKYFPLAPDELKDYDFDVLLIALYSDVSLQKYLKYELLIGTKNENKPVYSIIEPTFWFTLKVLLGVINE